MSYESISHSRWDCKYHVVFIPKCRRKELYGKIWKFLGPVFHEMARQKGCKIEEGHMVQDHVHMLIKIPPNFSVAEIIGYIKVKVIERDVDSENNLIIIRFETSTLRIVKGVRQW